jgi:GTP-binding protein HflX
MIDNLPTLPKTVLLTLKEESESQDSSTRRKEELESLATTMGVDIVESMILPLRAVNPSTLIGKGNVASLEELVKDKEIELVIFDQDLAPRMQRNLERIFDTAVIDRQEVILQIFSDRAATKEAVLQVALARQEYSLPRLTRRWSHLSRQRGGMRGTRDAGETQLEIDRRIVLRKIANFKKELTKVENQRAIQRKNRLEGSIPTVAIVGYTNAGKSSLLNKLADTDVLVEDKLFATLDPTTRKINLNHGGEIIISDTVGFVSNLPHQLVDSFKATLEETTYADLIIHLVDAAHPDVLNCYKTTKEVLDSLDCSDKPTLIFVNKMDAIYDSIAVNQIISENEDVIVGSVKNNVGLDKLLDQIEKKLAKEYPSQHYLFPHSRGDLVALIRREGSLLKIDYIDEGANVVAKVPKRLVEQLKPFIRN